MENKKKLYICPGYTLRGEQGAGVKAFCIALVEEGEEPVCLCLPHSQAQAGGNGRRWAEGLKRGLEMLGDGSRMRVYSRLPEAMEREWGAALAAGRMGRG